MIWPILEACAEIQKYFHSFFCSNEDIQKSFWNYLTFMKFYHKEYILGSKRVLFTRDLKAQSTFAAWNPCWFFVEYKVEIFRDCQKEKLKISPFQFWHCSIVFKLLVGNFFKFFGLLKISELHKFSIKRGTLNYKWYINFLKN